MAYGVISSKGIAVNYVHQSEIKELWIRGSLSIIEMEASVM